MTSPSSQLLTHSRLACFRACPRRHYLRYELGLRPEDTGFVLRVGSGFHRALEALDKGEDPELAIAEGLDDPFDWRSSLRCSTATGASGPERPRARGIRARLRFSARESGDGCGHADLARGRRH